MAPVEQMKFETAEWVVDACAAPGGKTTQIHDHLRETGVLVANEVVGSRVKPLGENLERWGTNMALITSLEISRLADLQGSGFSQVLVDAPCSGEGLFRRSPEARAEWSPAHVDGSARRQRAILEATARLVGPGDNLIYSTCTFAPEENEQVIAAFLDAHPSWTLDRLQFPGAKPGRTDWASTTHDLSGMVRLWPHLVEGDGHTIARLQRSEHDETDDGEGTGAPFSFHMTKSAEAVFNAFLAQTIPGLDYYGLLLQQQDRLYLLPEYGDLIGDLPMVRPGLWLGTVGPDRFTPSHALALYMRVEDCALVQELDFEETARYLSGETLTKPGQPGWVLIIFDGFPLGWGKRSGDVIKNHYPKGLRRPAASWLSAAG